MEGECEGQRVREDFNLGSIHKRKHGVCCLSLAYLSFLLLLFLEDIILLYCLTGSTIFLLGLQDVSHYTGLTDFLRKSQVYCQKRLKNNLTFQIAYQNNQHTFPILWGWGY